MHAIEIDVKLKFDNVVSQAGHDTKDAYELYTGGQLLGDTLWDRRDCAVIAREQRAV